MIIIKVAVIGSRSLQISNIDDYLPKDTTEIISGGAIGIDTCARAYAKACNIKFTEYLPKYNKYGRNAPLIRNEQIVNNADVIIAIWDGISNGTRYTINYAKKKEKKIIIIELSNID